MAESGELDEIPAFQSPALRGDIAAFRNAMDQWGWGRTPWRRLSLLIPLLIPAALLVRVGAVLDWRLHDTWLVVTAMDLGNWLQVAVGSFFAWLPSSGYAAMFLLVLLIPVTVRAWLGMRAASRERGRPVAVYSVADLGGFLVVAAPLLLLVWIGALYASAGDWRGIAIAAGVAVTGTMLGWLDFRAGGASAVTVRMLAAQIEYPPLPVAGRYATAADLISATTRAEVPYVLQRRAGGGDSAADDEDPCGYVYFDTDEVMVAIVDKALRPSDVPDALARRVPIVPGHRRATALAAAVPAQPVVAVRVNGDITVVYARAAARAPGVATGSVAEKVADGLRLAICVGVCAAAISAVSSPAPWLPQRCLEIGSGVYLKGSTIVDTGAGIVTIVDAPRRAVVVDRAVDADGAACA